jgi:hypothetical protein
LPNTAAIAAKPSLVVLAFAREIRDDGGLGGLGDPVLALPLADPTGASAVPAELFPGGPPNMSAVNMMANATKTAARVIRGLDRRSTTLGSSVCSHGVARSADPAPLAGRSSAA